MTSFLKANFVATILFQYGLYGITVIVFLTVFTIRYAVT